MDNPGNFMQKGKDQAVRALVSFFGVLVYVAGVVYAEVHGYSLLIRGVDPQFLLWSTVGIVALGITALFLPLGLHYSFHAPLQRIAAFCFYGVDLGLLIFNAVVDYAFKTGTGQALPGWLGAYMEYILPATPIIAAVGWSLLALLDPGQKERGMIETLKASTREALAARIAEQAKAVDVSTAVDQAAAQMARDIVSGALGASVAHASRSLPRETTELAPALPAAARTNGKAKRSIFMAPMRRPASRSYNETAAVDPLPQLVEADQAGSPNPTQPGNGQGR